MTNLDNNRVTSDYTEINLLDIWNIFKENIILFIAICLICSAVGFSIAKFVLPSKYEATAKIIIVKDENSGSNASVTYSDLQTSQKLASTYKQIFMSEAVSDAVINKLDLNNKYGITSKTYNNIVKVSAEDNTEVMSIKVETTDPELSATMANEIVDVFISKIYDIYDVQNVSILNSAKVPQTKSGPSTSKYTLMGGLVGLLISAIIIMIKYFTDTKVKTEEEVKAIFDYPIIGSIPEFVIKGDEEND